jgi:hypothetical protein
VPEMWEASDVMGHVSWSGEIRWTKGTSKGDVLGQSLPERQIEKVRKIGGHACRT